MVRMDSGVPEVTSASMMPGISRYRPSGRWYGSVLVPNATCGRVQDDRATSRRTTSATFTLTTIRLSKSRPLSRSRYSWDFRAKQYVQLCTHPRIGFTVQLNGIDEPAGTRFRADLACTS